jgi:hypothetical protein
MEVDDLRMIPPDHYIGNPLLLITCLGSFI